MKALGWHFSPWASDYLEMYSANIAHPYQEVRGAVADNLRVLSELRLHPSYGSVDEFIRDAQHPHARRSLVSVDATYEARIDEFGRQLAQWRLERKPASEGTSQYDKASMTILTWIWGSISEVRTSSAFPFITKLLPEFFRMQESTDNQVRHALASVPVLLLAEPELMPCSTPRTCTSSLRSHPAGTLAHGRPRPPRLRSAPVPAAPRSLAHAAVHRPTARVGELAGPARRPPASARCVSLSPSHGFSLNQVVKLTRCSCVQSSSTTTSSSSTTSSSPSSWTNCATSCATPRSRCARRRRRPCRASCAALSAAPSCRSSSASWTRCVRPRSPRGGTPRATRSPGTRRRSSRPVRPL